MADCNDTDPAVTREFQQARQALDDAAKARDADLSDVAVINRLYLDTARESHPSRE